MLRIGFKAIVLMAVTLLVAACSKGGQLTLEPGAIIVKSKGSPYVSVTQGGKAYLTSADGETGWVTVQAVSTKAITGGGHSMIVNKPSAH